ncbi:homoserine dehydrogenase [Megasphaera vaginalis (ex Srinivasan et al. 2021)]|uniref:Homoserine dehydrogenase n=1 Tax=Megasphaera vaginalis (ex Srinivasan et al. 2021) TaxID=1111454 RepID=U7UMS1_9FIRM|nr:homoserine dehydrogenase [Megasphaera vaginalis (ex Srinivasan et al. 2021)]ERT60616.1 homoserine dehydrogenase [Megasphaera vaginalis (ex Srinivasan et al. 2021)]
MKTVSIALLGCGTVGKGVIDLLEMNGSIIEEQLNTHLHIKWVLVRDLEKYREMNLPPSITLTTDFQDIVSDPEVEIVAEVMGSADFAKGCIEQCFTCGKSVVSANKDLIADYGIPLLKLSQENDVDFQFEASVAGGIPIIRSMHSSLNSNAIETIIGIMNGTTNYILSNMTERGLSYEAALAEAQQKGYAEADPTNDVSGYDAARKIAILATLGFHSAITFRDVSVEGIEAVTQDDIVHATEMGYVIKLLAIASHDEDGISLNVHPAFIRKGHPLANVGGAYNAVFVRGNCVGDLMYYGQGAGALPTASAVVSDIMSVVLHYNLSMTGKREYVWHETHIKSPQANKAPYYLRMIVANAPGVLSSISGVFARNNISIRSLIQKDETTEIAEIVVLIDSSADGLVRESLRQIADLSCVHRVASAIRVIEV